MNTLWRTFNLTYWPNLLLNGSLNERSKFLEHFFLFNPTKLCNYEQPSWISDCKKKEKNKTQKLCKRQMNNSLITKPFRLFQRNHIFALVSTCMLKFGPKPTFYIKKDLSKEHFCKVCSCLAQ